MPAFNPIIASLNFTKASSFSSGIQQFVSDRNLIFASFQYGWSDFTDWLQQPTVLSCLIAWSVTFAVIVVVLLGLGFGPAGVIAGSSAAAFQAWMYGGFTPAAGLFATLTSLGMLGYLMPTVAIFAATVASLVAMVVYYVGS